MKTQTDSGVEEKKRERMVTERLPEYTQIRKQVTWCCFWKRDPGCLAALAAERPSAPMQHLATCVLSWVGQEMPGAYRVSMLP